MTPAEVVQHYTPRDDIERHLLDLLRVALDEAHDATEDLEVIRNVLDDFGHPSTASLLRTSLNNRDDATAELKSLREVLADAGLPEDIDEIRSTLREEDAQLRDLVLLRARLENPDVLAEMLAEALAK
jgi:hypothetical protein